MKMEERANYITKDDETPCSVENSGSRLTSGDVHHKTWSKSTTEKPCLGKEQSYANLVSPQPFVKLESGNLGSVRETARWDFSNVVSGVNRSQKMGTTESSVKDVTDKLSTSSSESHADSDSVADVASLDAGMTSSKVKDSAVQNTSEISAEPQQLVRKNESQKLDISSDIGCNPLLLDNTSNVSTDDLTNQNITGKENISSRENDGCGTLSPSLYEEVKSSDKIRPQFSDSDKKLILDSRVHKGQIGIQEDTSAICESELSQKEAQNSSEKSGNDRKLPVHSEKVREFGQRSDLHRTDLVHSDIEEHNLQKQGMDKISESLKPYSRQNQVASESKNLSMKFEKRGESEMLAVETPRELGQHAEQVNSTESFTNGASTMDSTEITKRGNIGGHRTKALYDNTTASNDVLDTVPSNRSEDGSDLSVLDTSSSLKDRDRKLSFSDTCNLDSFETETMATGSSLISVASVNPTGVCDVTDEDQQYQDTDYIGENNIHLHKTSPNLSLDESEADIYSNDVREDWNIQTLMRQDSSENVVIEIKPRHRSPSPEEMPLDRSKSKSMENICPKDYLVFRANRKLALQKQCQPKEREMVNEGTLIGQASGGEYGNKSEMEVAGYQGIQKGDELKYENGCYQTGAHKERLENAENIDIESSRQSVELESAPNDLDPQQYNVNSESELDPGACDGDQILYTSEGNIKGEDNKVSMISSTSVLTLPRVVVQSSSDQKVHKGDKDSECGQNELLTSCDTDYPISTVVHSDLNAKDFIPTCTCEINLTNREKLEVIDSDIKLYDRNEELDPENYDDKSAQENIDEEGAHDWNRAEEGDGGTDTVQDIRDEEPSSSEDLELNCTQDIDSDEFESVHFVDGLLLLDNEHITNEIKEESKCQEFSSNIRADKIYDTGDSKSVNSEREVTEEAWDETHDTDIAEIQDTENKNMGESNKSEKTEQDDIGLDSENEDLLFDVSSDICSAEGTDLVSVTPGHGHTNGASLRRNSSVDENSLLSRNEVEHQQISTESDEDPLPEDREVEFILSNSNVDIQTGDDRSTISGSEDRNSEPQVTPESDHNQGSPGDNLSPTGDIEITQSDSEFDTAESGDDDDDADVSAVDNYGDASDTFGGDVYFEPLVEESDADLEMYNNEIPVKLPGVEKSNSIDGDDSLQVVSGHSDSNLRPIAHIEEPCIQSSDFKLRRKENESPVIGTIHPGDRQTCHTCEEVEEQSTGVTKEFERQDTSTPSDESITLTSVFENSLSTDALENENDVEMPPNVCDKDKAHENDLEMPPNVCDKDKAHENDVEMPPNVCDKDKAHENDVEMPPNVCDIDKARENDVEMPQNVCDKDKAHENDVEMPPNVCDIDKAHESNNRVFLDEYNKAKTHERSKEMSLNEMEIVKENESRSAESQDQYNITQAHDNIITESSDENCNAKQKMITDEMRHFVKNENVDDFDEYVNICAVQLKNEDEEISDSCEELSSCDSDRSGSKGQKEMISKNENHEGLKQHGKLVMVESAHDNDKNYDEKALIPATLTKIRTKQISDGQKNKSAAYPISTEQKLTNVKRKTRGPFRIVNKERLRAVLWNVISPSKVKDQEKGSLIGRKQKLHTVIHRLNTKKKINFDDYKGIEDDMIWKLLKSLTAKSSTENLFEENDDDVNSKDSSKESSNLEENKSKSNKSVTKDFTEKEKSTEEQQNKEKGGVRVLTFFSSLRNKKKIEFTPLILPTRTTLPFDVTELFKKEVWNARNKKMTDDIRQLNLITGQKVIIKEKSPKQEVEEGDNRRGSSENDKMGSESGSPVQGVVTQAPKVYKMSATQLILPKLDLISHPGIVQDRKSPAHLPEKEISKEDLNAYVDEKEESAIEEDMGQVEGENNLSLSEMLAQAFEKLNSSRLDDAESQLLRLYQQMQEKPEDNTKILVQTLTSLADICVRRSRMCRSNPMEWQWLCMHSIALLQYTVEVCESEMESQMDNQDTDWFQEHKHGAELKCRPLEDSFNRALYNCLKHEGRKYMDPFRSFSFPNTPTTPNRLGLFPLSTGRQVPVFPGMHYKYSSTMQDRNETMDDMKVGLDWLTKFHHYCNDRLQTRNLGDICNKIFKKRRRTASMNGDNDETASVVSDAGSLDWDHNDLQGIEELDFEPMRTNSPVKDHTFAFELASSDVEDDGWDFFLNDRRSCKFQSVVQVASRKQNHVEKAPNRDLMNAKNSTDKVKEIISPLHEHSIKLTLAKSFTRLADKLVQEEEYEKAEVLLEEVLNIVEVIQDGTAGMLKFSAKILKSLGTVKSKRGKSAEGLELLNRALQTYKDLQDEESNFEIAVALLELGNGYVVGKSNDDGVYEDAIAAICEFFEKDLSDEQMSSSSSSGKSDIQMRTQEEEENIEEAIHCYKEALSLLDNYENEKQMDVVAKSTMRLGDCYFMQKDYGQALECFEKALTLFHATSTLGREFVLEHAHVMCMLGVSTFMLHMYPRAASTFELALHLVKYAFGLNSTFLHGLILSMMGITFYKMKNYHRCVSACYQGFEIFCSLHGDKLPTLPKRKFWLVCQILYVMGNSYNVLNLHQKAIKYLTVARTLMMACKMRERRQFMRVLQILGDCYFAQYDYKTALQFYNEALEYGDCESQVSFDEVFDPNAASDQMTMHNQLVSKSAEAHISMQQYQNAVHYLEQAHDMQEDMGNDIKGDLIHTLNQLGQMHSVAGDVDQAIDSFNESLEVFREIHNGELGPEMCTILGNLGTMCYVKACISEEIDQELEMILAAEEHFQNAMCLEVNPSVSVKYANFLYSQANYEDAIMYLHDALRIPNISEAPDITYGGLEKVTLPDCLQDEVDCMEEVVLSPTALARYLLILSHKMLGQLNNAEVYLHDLLHDVMSKDIPILYSVLGYSMMEFMLFEEAMCCFDTAIDLECDYQLAIYNYNLCLCICLYITLVKGIENICAFYNWSIFDLISV